MPSSNLQSNKAPSVEPLHKELPDFNKREPRRRKLFDSTEIDGSAELIDDSFERNQLVIDEGDVQCNVTGLGLICS